MRFSGLSVFYPHFSRLLRSSTFRLGMMYIALFGSSAILLIVFLYWATTGYLAQQIDETIEAEVQGLAEQYRRDGFSGLLSVLRERIKKNTDGRAYYLLADAYYRPLRGNLSQWPQEARDETQPWVNFSLSVKTAKGKQQYQARARVFVLLGSLHLLVGRDMQSLEKTRHQIWLALGWGLLLTIWLALIGGLLLSNGVLRRIEQINQTSREIMAGKMSQRIPLTGSGDDFDQLAGHLNAMLDQIESLMAGIRHISDNIAHDLRTPLTRLRNRLEQMQQNPDSHNGLDVAIAEADQLLNTFNALLRITRIESSQENLVQKVDFSALVNDAVEFYAVMAEEKQQILQTQIQADLYLSGDRDLLFQALLNVLDNAIKYTPTSGLIRVALFLQSAQLHLEISDSGCGIPEAQYEQVLQRFFRLEHSRSTPGNGLGLSLVAAVVQRHQGQIQFMPNHLTDAEQNPETGLTVLLSFPVFKSCDL
ncbi:sensor histidine kinase [Candidatus Venteria ishoeyi]|uniref:histidine kinase n=1 Tax=Candidatus Venteria ishoeyi TaxID=1899563 RepID=A0A1H6FF22_9GAMM|nr:HAMP domain-containing sensor histidine kinase [Candidatus Venteria ishoeyi]SEH07635.1 Sensor histidine kinase YycG [Candidatus Venteria ishoeyi]